jgi:hypothetical protein
LPDSPAKEQGRIVIPGGVALEFSLVHDRIAHGDVVLEKRNGDMEFFIRTARGIDPRTSQMNVLSIKSWTVLIPGLPRGLSRCRSRGSFLSRRSTSTAFAGSRLIIADFDFHLRDPLVVFSSMAAMSIAPSVV